MTEFVLRLFVLCALLFGSVGIATAHALLSTEFAEAPEHDFISHFGFTESHTTPSTSGVTEHLFMSDSWGVLLGLGTDQAGRIVHMKLVIPRSMIDEQKHTLAGRDIVKSFVLAATTMQSDFAKLGPLVDEIWIRDLDLHPVQVQATTFADTGKPIPPKAYKIGSGPMKPGDRVIFLDKLPALASQPSEMYGAFAGILPTAVTMSHGCRLSFQNDRSKPEPYLVCEAWDEKYWSTNLEPKTSKPQQKETSEQSSAIARELSRAQSLTSEGKHAQAIEILRQLSDAHPDDLACQLSLGAALELSGDHIGAITALKKAVDIEEQTRNWSADLHLVYAQALIGAHKVQEALHEQSRAIEIEPNSPRARFQHGLTLLGAEDPVICRMAERELEQAEKLGWTDYRLPALRALAKIKTGAQAKGLAALRSAVAQIPISDQTRSFVEEMTATADELEQKLKNRAPAPVAPQDRRYTIPEGTSAVIADRNEAAGTVTLAISGGHDPDGGRQDGTDDGIIEMPWDQINKPSAVYRSK